MEDCESILNEIINNANNLSCQRFSSNIVIKAINSFENKYKNKMTFTKGEKYFFSINEIRKVLKELNKKRF